MKLLIVATALISCLQYCSAVVNCNVAATGVTPVSTVCPDVSSAAETHCSGPIFIEYDGPFDDLYACGNCGANSKTPGTDCVECPVTGTTPCNTVLAAGTTFKCYAWTWDPTATPAATKKGDELTCHLAETAVKAKKCRQPTETSAAETTVGGCGECPSGTVSAGTCKECPGGDSACNSAAAFTTLLALAALFYNMM